MFCHHITGGVESGPFVTPYGRGGVEAAGFEVDGLPTYEWGGENAIGEDVFDLMRPGWAHGPVHEVLAGGGVDIFFHGHDHCYVEQDLDGVRYLTCPVPWDIDYSDGFFNESHYVNGTKCNNSGHIRATVYPGGVKVDYVRSVLPEHEPLYDGGMPVYSGDVFRTFYLGAAGAKDGPAGELLPRLLVPSPNPSAGDVEIRFELGSFSRVSLDIYDARGRHVRRVLDEDFDGGCHAVTWDGLCPSGRPVAAGVYYCRLRAGLKAQTRKIALLR